MKSIVSQNYNDFEYLIIDGASTDTSKSVIKKYADKITYWISEPDSGIYNAMNKGIRRAKGDYLLFINSGDTLYNTDVLSDIFEQVAAKNEPELVYGDLQRVFPGAHTDIVSMPKTVTMFRMIYSTLAHPVTFIKKDLFDKYGLYREDLRIVSDWVFFLKLIIERNVSQLHLPIVVASFDMSGISNLNYADTEAEREKALNSMFSAEMLRILHNFHRYERFYNKKIFVFMRQIKQLILKIIKK
ncbi:MAG: glycosyltransferase [Candidatus Symbiothrix sp.]|nr:glycosyltransferase [Candidatus Symbiothrix sp.]